MNIWCVLFIVTEISFSFFFFLMYEKNNDFKTKNILNRNETTNDVFISCFRYDNIPKT